MMIFETFFRLRYISLIAVASLFIGAVLMFLAGAERTINAALVYFTVHPGESPGHITQSTLSSVALIQAVDAFLFALVLLIFSYGIYVLFVYNASKTEMATLPRWLQVENISGLKTTLIQVIIVILAVNVLEYVILVGPAALKWEVIIIPASILCLAAALRLMHADIE